MKNLVFLISLVFCSNLVAQDVKKTHNGHPVIQAQSDWTEYQVGDEWYRGQWSIAPQVEHDTLQIICYESKENFEFNTDSDSIKIEVTAGMCNDFYVQLNDTTFAHTIIHGVAFNASTIEFDEGRNPDIRIMYPNEHSEYLESLKASYALDFLNDTMSDTEVVLAVLNWTHNRWEHSGNHSPSKNDAITILDEAKQGQQFPCFAYAIVLRDQLSALGYKARTIYLKTQDAEHRLSPPGHVATEVYLPDIKKWVFLDGQFNVMPVLNDVPLNAIEFQKAIGDYYDVFRLNSLSEKTTSKQAYITFVNDYLYYLDTALDNRYIQENRHTIDGKRSLMLVPSGAPDLSRVNFWNMDVNYCIYTHSLSDFYATPK